MQDRCSAFPGGSEAQHTKTWLSNKVFFVCELHPDCLGRRLVLSCAESTRLVKMALKTH